MIKFSILTKEKEFKMSDFNKFIKLLEESYDDIKTRVEDSNEIFIPICNRN